MKVKVMAGLPDGGRRWASLAFEWERERENKPISRVFRSDEKSKSL